MAQPLLRVGTGGAGSSCASVESVFNGLRRGWGGALSGGPLAAARAADSGSLDFVGLAEQRRERPFAHARAFSVCHW